MEWLLLAALGIMWVAFLLPTSGRRTSPSTTVDDFERRMELLAQAETHGGPGRWIITPRKGVRFVGPAQRQRVRARERRKKVLTLLLEVIGITFMIGIVPPLRVLWAVTGVFAALLVVYVWLLLSIKQRAAVRPHERAAAANARPSAAARVAATAHRYVAEGRSVFARPAFNGLGSLGEGDRVHVVVKPAGQAVGS